MMLAVVFFHLFAPSPFFFQLDCNNDLTQVVGSIQKVPKGNIIPQYQQTSQKVIEFAVVVSPGEKILAPPPGGWTCPHLQSDNLALGGDGEMAERNKMENVSGGTGEKPKMCGNFLLISVQK